MRIEALKRGQIIPTQTHPKYLGRFATAHQLPPESEEEKSRKATAGRKAALRFRWKLLVTLITNGPQLSTERLHYTTHVRAPSSHHACVLAAHGGGSPKGALLAWT
jgi:hypothetical protein